MTTFRFLHLTDLHLGLAGQAHLWPNFEDQFFADLEGLQKRVGQWDLVLFTGDLTQKGSAEEFAALEVQLQRLWKKFAEWGFQPKLLAVPGNHDLVRPTDGEDPTLITLLHNWESVSVVQTAFWGNAGSPQRRLVETAFAHYTHWWNTTKLPKPARLVSGVVPGDCSARLEKEGLTLGVVGLNSAFLQLSGGDFEGKLSVDVRQLNAVCGQHPGDWVREHDACLLLTHHPIEWLSDKAQQHFAAEIHAPPERFALHLFGHMHEGRLSTIALGGGEERRRLQGTSLFGLECWGEGGERREHGYSLCELKLEHGELALRVWPRHAKTTQGGDRRIVRDESSFNLTEEDGGTQRLVVKHMGAKTVVSAPSASQISATPLPSYDPRNPPFYVPFHPKGDQVIGRSGVLEKVRQQLTSGRRTAIGQTAVFQGLGGLGKTQLAVEYAYRYRNDYPKGVVWLTADQDLDAQLSDLAVKARWVSPETEHKFRLEIARHRLRSYSECLLVFDNVEQIASIQAYLPEPPAAPHILVTSRTEQPDFIYVPIDLLDSEQSMRLLIQEAGREPEVGPEYEAAQQIAQLLGGLPLALELAGAYLARRPVSWQQYRDLLRHNLLQALPDRLASLTRHEADLYSTLQIGSSVFAEEPRLRDVLEVLTWSASAPMSLSLLASLIGVAEHELTGALGLGTALRLLQKAPDTDSYAIHRLVQEVQRRQESLSERAAWVGEVCQRLAEWFGKLREDFQQLPRFEADIDHLRAWHEHAFILAPQHASRLTWLQAYPPFHRSQFQEIKCLIEVALAEYTLQPEAERDQALLANLKNDLAYASFWIGDARAALTLAEESLEIRLDLFGESHPDTATSLNNLAGYTDALGDSKEALKLGEQALAIRRKLFGEHHPDTARSLNNLASYTDALGDAKGALKLGEQALAIRRKLFGEHHPDTARSLNNLASYTDALGDVEGALKLGEQALAIRRELFGERHPDTANSLNNLATYIQALGDARGALKLAEQAIAIRRELFGDYHTDTAHSLHNIASIELALGRTASAYEHALLAYQIFKQLRGEDHPHCLQAAGLLRSIKRPGFRVPASKKAAGSKGRKR